MHDGQGLKHFLILTKHNWHGGAQLTKMSQDVKRGRIALAMSSEI